MVLLGEWLWQYGYRLWQPLLGEHASEFAIAVLVHLVLYLLKHSFLALFGCCIHALCFHILFERIFVRHDEHHGVRVLVVVQNDLLDILATIGQTIFKSLWAVFLAIGTDKQ